MFKDEKVKFQYEDELCESANVETLEMCRGSCPSSQYMILMGGVQVAMNDCNCCQGTPGGFRNVDVICIAPSGATRTVTTEVATGLICGCHECVLNDVIGI